jgi:hypothetical protein
MSLVVLEQVLQHADEDDGCQRKELGWHTV